MLDINSLRTRQEQKVVNALLAWDTARKGLEDAIALAETREREFKQISADVGRKLEALDLVAGMIQEQNPKPLAEPAPLMLTSDLGSLEKAIGPVVHATSRPLFPFLRRSKVA